MTQTSPKPNPPSPQNGSTPDNLSSDEMLTVVSYGEPPSVPPDTAPEADSEIFSQTWAASSTSAGERQVWQPEWWRKLSLRAKATIIAMTIGTLPVLVTGTLNYQVSSQQATRETVDTQKSRALDASNLLGNFLSERYGNLQLLARLPILNNPRGTAGVSPQQKQAILDQFLQSYNAYDSIAVADLKGNTILQSTGEPVTGLGERDYFKEVLKTRQPVITPPRRSFLSGKYSIFMAAPVFDATTGELISIVRTRIPVERFADRLQAVGLGSKKLDNLASQQVFLVDGQGKYFFNQDKALVGQPVQANFSNFPQLQTAHQLATQFLINQKDNKKQLLTYAPLPSIKGMSDLKWSLLLTLDSSEALALQRQVLLTFLMGTGATTIVVAILAALIAEQATRPLLQAAKAVDQIGRGELETRLAVQGQDEFAVLGTNINIMAAQIESLIERSARSAQQASLLKEITVKLTEALEPETLFDLAVVESRQFLSADRVLIYRFDETWAGKVIAESVDRSYPQALGAQIADPCFADRYVKQYRQGRVQATPDISQAGLTPCHLKQLEPFAVKANLVTPIRVEGELYGLLIAHQCSAPRQWQEEEISCLTQIATQVGATLERLALLEQQRLDSQRAKLLKDITLKIASVADADAIFNIAVQESRAALQADRAIVYCFDRDWKGKIIAESVGEGWPAALNAEIADPCFADRYVEKYRQGRVQATPDIYQARLTQCHLKQLQPFAVRANLVTPIVAGGELQGLLIAHQCAGPRQWEGVEVDFLTQIAAQIGSAIERLNLLQQGRLAAEEQRREKEMLQRRALELLMEVDPVSRGDLTIRASVTEDEIGTVADSYNATIENLRKIVSQVQLAAQQVATTTSQSDPLVQAFSQRALQQSEEITAALDRLQVMANSMRSVAMNAEQAEISVQQATRTVEAGELAMNRTVDGIMAIRETVAETAKKVKRLGESSQKISKVVNLIGSFADQTNLLALNASIEAAHAGEEGRGFAVVADEVRSLARQSAQATAEIEALVAGIQAETNEVVAAMEMGTEQVVAGTKLVEEARQNLTQITIVSQQISELVEAIAQDAIEQAQSSDEVTQAIVEVAAISDQTSTEATEVSNSFKQLLSVAQTLQASVKQFKVS
jgi:methyl-accepting chemotaxis protein PixJ